MLKGLAQGLVGERKEAEHPSLRCTGTGWLVGMILP